MSNFANLEILTLGDADLGAGLGQLFIYETPITLTESMTKLMQKILSEIITTSILESRRMTISPLIEEQLTTAIVDYISQQNLRLSEVATTSIAESLAMTITLQLEQRMPYFVLFPNFPLISEYLKPAMYLSEEILTTINESLWYPTQAQAGIIGRIVLRIDITDFDFCAAVDETGMSIYLNGTPERAYLFPKQVGQKFESNKQIYAGDAVMFSCPDLAIAIGDQVVHNNIYYTIIAITDDFIGGNLIVRKSGLRRYYPITTMPSVFGLVAAPNLEGKTTLTWEPINTTIYTNFAHFIVFRASGTWTSSVAAALDYTNTPPTTPTNGDRYLTGAAPTGAWAGQANKIATWNGTAWTFAALPASPGMVYAIGKSSFYYSNAGVTTLAPFSAVETTKNNTFNDKNLVPNTKYTYYVVALDMINNIGLPSGLATTPIDETPPPQVTGLR